MAVQCALSGLIIRFESFKKSTYEVTSRNSRMRGYADVGNQRFGLVADRNTAVQYGPHPAEY